MRARGQPSLRRAPDLQVHGPLAPVQLRQHQAQARTRELTRVGLLTKLLFFPVAGPVAGIRWTLGQVQHVAERELTDDTKIKNDLMELQLRLELGEIDEAEYAQAEAVLMRQLRDVREWRERLQPPG